MAKKSDLKKDVKFLADDLYSIISVKIAIDGMETQKAIELASKVSLFKTNFLDKVNHPGADKADAKAVKAAYRQIGAELFQQYADLSEELSKAK